LMKHERIDSMVELNMSCICTITFVCVQPFQLPKLSSVKGKCGFLLTPQLCTSVIFISIGISVTPPFFRFLFFFSLEKHRVS
jgi:hypothetical protein